MKKITFFLFLFFSIITFSQVTITPSNFDINESITISVNASSTNTDCNGLSNLSKLYIHSGVGTDVNPWGTEVVGNWGSDDGVGEMTFNSSNSLWEITFTPKTYYGLTDEQASSITKIGMVFRNASGTQELKTNGCNDFVFNVGTFQITLNTPLEETSILNSGELLSINATASLISNFNLKANGTSIDQKANLTIYSYTPTITENTIFVLEATNNGEIVNATFNVIIKPTVVEETIPTGMKDGFNINGTSVTFVLYAPNKEFVHLIGSFNNWAVTDNYALKKDSTKDRFWIELTNLPTQEDITYQYLVEGTLKIADPYSTQILDPNEDQYIDGTTYPNMPSYPTGSTNHSVTLLRTGDTPYNWEVTSFQKPAKTDLVIYELLIRDFDALHSFDAVKARLNYLQELGVNAIELMPVNEFDGNLSWGYNPSFHMALDKYYGSPASFKQLIDECHKRGIAVILDVVYNHATGQNPFYRMWNTNDGGYQGTANTDSPFFNQTATHSYSVFNDFNHSKQATKDYVKRTSQYWIDEYKIDGFRWDLTKGFTQNCTSNDEGCTGNYQSDRVAVLKEYADYQWEIDANSYVIFEHLGGNTEETEWVNYRLSEGKGIMMWGNHNFNYSSATRGKHTNGYSSDFSWVSYQNRGWSVPANVSYMESHDEERLMYENISDGGSNGSYNIQTSTTALERMELVGAFYFTVPGPKMIWQFGELGYDISINQNGRTGEKPIKWEYFDDQNRKDIYTTWSKLIQLKLKYDIFRTSDFTLDVSNTNGLKKIQLTNTSATDIQYINVIGNFGLTNQNINPVFQKTGTWYDVLNDNQSLNISNTNGLISLAPGEFKVYASQPAILSNDEFILENESIKIYPIPTSTHFSLSDEVLELSIYNITGQQVKKYAKKVIQNNSYLVSDLTAGIYFVRIKKTNNQIFTKKLIIN
ncbi:MAG: 1,4-alpha-glucan branching enzyme [Planctomycetota bacterium]|jgi:1,4-alpha-glucan branching enzyme